MVCRSFGWQLSCLSLSVLLMSDAQEAKAIGFPFGPGQTWTVCRGYNVGNLVTGDTFHLNKPVLDLSIASNSAGANGCIGDANASTNKEVVSTGTGMVTC